ncbi:MULTISPECIES: uroporphyrinogen decarboxylase family protein [unclassified Oceanispirochaeta]|uniref:uroporphyrinogen decarboxylase family protein n=1 Tax=unclassified Oceanispirochaeta TaxID=2635722 RepID=UPI000E09C551|nr:MULTISPECIES: uroporphyrinogen decarboxylase family protein [unclassified Oceanispirochaeta]MBF9014276.1 hypothetical protein [Oceanispirochaeta sp. M2]NPD71162.1 hypothetical protein [Oceanispirochaeta sp. M1]RDG33554.1 hypothetical protein DV872_03525 [Oceanispirochaeta sp. M1]
MTSRERVASAINWQKPDRIPVHEDFWTDTLTIWKDQGLPSNIEIYPHVSDKSKTSVDDYFDFDIACMYLDASPRYEQKILSRDGENYTYTDRWGYTAEKPWEKSGSIHYVSTETKDRETWENEVKPRFVLDEDDTARIDDHNYFEHFLPYPSWSGAKKKFDSVNSRERYILFKNYGPWEATWRHRDFSNLLMDIALEPDWVREMADTHLNLTLDILKKCLKEGMRPDGYFMVDDLGGSNAPLMSPDMWMDVLQPSVKKLGEFLKSEGIDFWMHSCGNAEMLYEPLIDCGVKVMNPLQASAGLDIRTMVEKYRDRLAFYGNIDAHLLGKDWLPLEEELKTRKEMFKTGGWICHTDHSIPPDMNMEDFQKMVDLIRSDT